MSHLRAAHDFTIRELTSADFPTFLLYLNDHLQDNGKDGQPLFQPLSRSQSHFPVERAAAFQAGLETPIGSAGWRRAWIAQDATGKIVGHIDLRSHPELFTSHRCVLGMGVHRDHRRLGLGQWMLQHAEAWARSIGSLAWIDLQVLSQNQAALRLYQRNGFQLVGEVRDMFVIDGQLVSTTIMNKFL